MTLTSPLAFLFGCLAGTLPGPVSLSVFSFGVASVTRSVLPAPLAADVWSVVGCALCAAALVAPSYLVDLRYPAHLQLGLLLEECTVSLATPARVLLIVHAAAFGHIGWDVVSACVLMAWFLPHHRAGEWAGRAWEAWRKEKGGGGEGDEDEHLPEEFRVID